MQLHLYPPSSTAVVEVRAMALDNLHREYATVMKTQALGSPR